jgi:hypothetical protein
MGYSAKMNSLYGTAHHVKALQRPLEIPPAILNNRTDVTLGKFEGVIFERNRPHNPCICRRRFDERGARGNPADDVGLTPEGF